MLFDLMAIIMGIILIIGGYMIKQQRWLFFHFGIRKINVDIEKFTQYAYRMDSLFGLGYIIIGMFAVIFEVNLNVIVILYSIIMIVFLIYAETKFKVR